MPNAARLLAAHFVHYAAEPGAWWLTIPEATALTGWPRQTTHRLIRTGVIATRKQRIPGRRPLVRIDGADLLAIVRSRRP